jgi:hypothetical protein
MIEAIEAEQADMNSLGGCGRFDTDARGETDVIAVN